MITLSGDRIYAIHKMSHTYYTSWKLEWKRLLKWFVISCNGLVDKYHTSETYWTATDGLCVLSVLFPCYSFFKISSTGERYLVMLREMYETV